MTDSEYPKAIYLARISEKTGNYENAIKYIENIINMKSSDITNEKKNILQTSWRTLCKFIDRELNNKKVIY